MVHTAETREAARGELIEGWDRDRRPNPGASRIILTHTNAEVRDLNEAARDRMHAAGELGDDVRITTGRGDRDCAARRTLRFLPNGPGLDGEDGPVGTGAEGRGGR